MIELIEQFQFIRPQWLWAFIPLFLAFIALNSLRNKSSNWYDLIDPELIEHLLDNPANTRSNRHSALPLLAAATGCCITVIALAGPSWEKLPTVTEQKVDALVIIADLTLSMHATDIKPSRLVRSRYKLLELLKQREAGQTALIAYSGDAHIVSPLTDDASTIAALVPSLAPEIMPSIGSNAIAAFKSANQILENAGISRAKIAWFTDEALAADVSAVSDLVAQRNSELVIVGIGTETGGPVPLPSGKFVKDNSGRVVNAPLTRIRLQSITRATGGSYLDMHADNTDIDFILSESTLQRLYNQQANTDDKANRQQQNLQTGDSWNDRGATLALLLIPFALASFRRGWLLSLFLMVYLFPSSEIKADILDDFSWQDLWQTRDQRAYELERQQQHKAAAEIFNNPQWKGIAEFNAGNYKNAVETLTPDADTEANHTAAAHYNRGHALAYTGDLDGAIDAYKQSLKINPNSEQAKQAKALVESLKQQQQQQQKDQNQQDSQQQNNDQQNGDQQKNKQQNSQQQPSPSESDSQQQSDQQSQQSSQQSSQQQSQQNEQQQDQQQVDEQAAEQLLNQQAAREEDQQQEQLTQQKQAQMQNPQSGQESDTDQSQVLTAEQQLDAEQQAKLNQWLKKIPDDPGGLLRRKFKYERQVREQQGKVIDERENGQIW